MTATITQTAYPLWGGNATIMTTQESRLSLVRDSVDQVVADIDQACSAYRDDSDLARVNAGAGRPVRVGTTFVEVLRAAVRGAELSDGLVDPTAPGSARRIGRRPAHLWQEITIDPSNETVRLPEGATLDLGAVGKAFAADLAASLAVEQAGCGVLVALSGDIATAGPAPEGGWPVRVSHDQRPGRRTALPPGQHVTLPPSTGLATSSLALRSRRSPGGRIITHIVDPRSGAPVRGPWRTVSVAAGNCVDANIASTAAIVRGAGAARWLERLGLPARLVHIDGWVTTVAGWPSDTDAWPGLKVAG